LYREDEIAELELPDVQARIGHGQHGPITLHFGPPELFGGHGILLPCVDDTPWVVRGTVSLLAPTR
jgi:hypothetical protein